MRLVQRGELVGEVVRDFLVMHKNTSRWRMCMLTPSSARSTQFEQSR
jgi:hypothetical protein